ncbi:hypothetical protein, partial [Bacteroides sp.]|uniref:hypothetical protein n=1 Tax=Bacteroides sp. TaxID=29523 RepID=UPI00260AC2E7
MDNDEIQNEVLTRLDNFQTLMMIKRRLGDLVDIEDRLFGYCGCGECDNSPFIFSSIAVILSLPDDKECNIEECHW